MIGQMITILFLELVKLDPFALSANTQQDTHNKLFGNEKQSGYLLHQSVLNLIDQGEALSLATKHVLRLAISGDNLEIPLITKQVIVENSIISHAFITAMVVQNALFSVTKSIIERYPTNTTQIIVLSVGLYPQFAQIAINAAIITGEIDSNEAVIVAISAGADPTSVSEATAAGVASAAKPIILASPAPIGAGIAESEFAETITDVKSSDTSNH
jgi:hypothetical protein